jgi:hypothetical protein
MKYKLKSIDTELLNYSSIPNKTFNSDSKLINVKYVDQELEFQTPRVIIDKIIKENNKEYLILKLLPNEASKTFYQKLLDIESNITKRFNGSVVSIIDTNFIKVKIPFKYDKPLLNIFLSDDTLFNYYHLKVGMEVIILLSMNNLWINPDNTINYHLNVKEMIIFI